MAEGEGLEPLVRFSVRIESILPHLSFGLNIRSVPCATVPLGLARVTLFLV